MITADTFDIAEKGLKEIFPDANVKNAMEPGKGIKVFCTVQEINTEQLTELQKHVWFCDAEIKIKRSGTGLSIHLN